MIAKVYCSYFNQPKLTTLIGQFTPVKILLKSNIINGCDQNTTNSCDNDILLTIFLR